MFYLLNVNFKDLIAYALAIYLICVCVFEYIISTFYYWIISDVNERNKKSDSNKKKLKNLSHIHKSFAFCVSLQVCICFFHFFKFLVSIFEIILGMNSQLGEGEKIRNLDFIIKKKII